jgi:beta-RFAP synthase
MTRVVAPSRLHFGLLHVPVAGLTRWPDGLPVRRFGGVGLMVNEPGVAVSVEAAADWSGHGPNGNRALDYARRVAAALADGCERPLRVTVERCPPEHVGLGVGTQLGLAVARAVSTELGFTGINVRDLARWVGRAERSGIGSHGFAHGGLLVEGGKRDAELAVLLGRYEFPSDWRIVLARPRSTQSTWSGPAEQHAFNRTRQANAILPLTERMARVLLVGILPAVLEHDCGTFGKAVQEYNQQAGRMFTNDQGGVYSSPLVQRLVESARQLGATGAGQSSWGPTIFAFCANDEMAQGVSNGLRRDYDELDITITSGNNTGAVVM